MKILVTGATGYVGGRLVPRLLALGHEIVCLARDPSHISGRGWERVDVRRGDALDAGSLLPAMEGVDVAYYLIHSMTQGEGKFEDRDRMAAEHFGMAASAAGVHRIIYLGGLGKADEALSPHLASRHEVGRILRSSGVPVTEFRAAVIVGSGSISFEIIRYLIEGLPMMFTPRWMETRCQPIAIANVLDYLTLALQEPGSVGRTLEIGGPDVLSYREMMLGYASARKLRRILVPLPVLTPRLSSAPGAAPECAGVFALRRSPASSRGTTARLDRRSPACAPPNPALAARASDSRARSRSRSAGSASPSISA